MDLESIQPEEPRLRHVPDEWNEVTRRVIGCAVEVHRNLGVGLLERHYEEALAYELTRASLRFSRQHLMRLRYKDIQLSDQYLDLVVEDLVVLELKAVDRVCDTHLAQLVSYLRAADLPLGLLINFHALRLTDGIYRRINNRSSRFPPQSDRSPRSSAPSATSAF